jgi:hypothetical protein
MATLILNLPDGLAVPHLSGQDRGDQQLPSPTPGSVEGAACSVELFLRR